MTDFSSIIGLDKDRTVSLPLLALVSAIAFLCSVASINALSVYILLGTVGSFVTVILLRDPRIRFLAVLAVVMMLQLTKEESGTTITDYLAGAYFGGGFAWTFIKKKLIERKAVSFTPLFLPFILFLVWSAGIGILGVFTGGPVTLDKWLRELLELAPPLLLPIFFAEIIEQKVDAGTFLTRSIFLLWIIVFIFAILKIQSNIVGAVYLYQVGHARYDATIGSLMMLVFLSIAMSLPEKNRALLLVGFVLAAISLIITFARTSWLAVLPCFPILFVLASRDERRRGYRFALVLLAISSTLVLIGYIFFPWVKLGLLFISQKFVGGTQLKTDASMYNRFVEWRYVIDAIKDSPLVGYGLGAKYHGYNWLTGQAIFYEYTHNGYLAALFKSGIIGTILLATSYLGFFIQGIKLLYNKYLSRFEVACLRGGVVTIIFISISGLTTNILFQREFSIYIAMYWCYCYYLMHKTTRLRETQKELQTV